MLSSPAVFRSLRALSLKSGSISARDFHFSPRRNDQFLNANSETFKRAIATEDKIVLVDFYADWCNPCKILSPILEKITNESSLTSGSGRSVDLVTVDTDSEFELGSKYQIRSLPTVIAFKDGKPVDQFIGAVNETGVRKFIQRL